MPILVLKSKNNLFYLLALMPLVLIAFYFYFSGRSVLGVSIPYYSRRSVLGVLIPFYAFLILFLKKDELSQFHDSSKLQRFGGLVAMLASFFIFYMVLGLDSYALYAAETAFYTVYILGLLLVFFGASALKESFSAVFLIVAGGSSFYVGGWLEFYVEPLVPYFVQFSLLVIRLLGIPATGHNPITNTILLNTSKGPVIVSFVAGCLGVYSTLAFWIIIVVAMMEEPTNVRTKLLWSIGGAIGSFFINLIRVSLIAWVIYYYGYEGWGYTHSWIGYSLFFLWLGFFFVVFSKRKVIQNKIRVLWQKF